MKNFIITFLITLNYFLGFSQTVIQYDYMETWNWSGYWAFTTPVTPVGVNLFTAGGASGWSTNASVSTNESAVLYGTGNGNSNIEQNWYVLPNITGLDPNKLYQFKFKLASYTFSSPTAATRGLDIDDILEVQVSTNGGVSYVTELRITGRSNAQWPYTSTGSITHTSNGSFTNSAAPIGDVCTSPAGTLGVPITNGYSTVILDLPLNISQVAVDIFCRVNSAGEEWWLDNIELIEIDPLPVEMISFEGFNTEKGNLLVWKTSSEHNSDYYLIECSTTGEFNENTVIGQKTAAGNSTQIMEYSFVDNNFRETINYYRLTQVDYNGVYKIYGPIAVDNTTTKKEVVKYVNLLGQEVNYDYKGIFFEIYSDGTSKKIYR